MATGALIAGTALGLGSSYSQYKAGKKAARGQRDAARDQYDALVGAVDRSRQIEDDRARAEQIADDALRQANEEFRRLNDKKFASDQAMSRDWAAANKERRAIELANIELGAEERAEEIRRIERENEIIEGRATTLAGASGFGAGSSLDRWVDTIVATHESDVAWMVEAGARADALARQDANLRFKTAEAERSAFNRSSLLGYETGESQYQYYESQRLADAAMREVARQERESQRKYTLESGKADMMAGFAQAGATSSAARGSLYGGLGNAFSAFPSIASSYRQFGWGFG